MSEQNIAYYVYRGPFAAFIAKFSYSKRTTDSYTGCVVAPGQERFGWVPMRVLLSDAANTYEDAKAMAIDHLAHLVFHAQTNLDQAQKHLDDAQKWEPK